MCKRRFRAVSRLLAGKIVRPIAITILAACFFVAVGGALAQGAYPAVECSFNANSLSTNPVVLFDYTQTDIQVQILQPDGSTITIPGFYDGGTTWRARSTPMQTGSYSIHSITLNGSPLTVSNLSPAYWTVTGFPVRRGFVSVDPSYPRRFRTSDGRRFFPVGQDIAWSSPTSDILSIIPKMGAAHETWGRIWMTHFYDNGTTLGLNLDWPMVNTTFGEFSLTNSSHWDALIAAADQAGIHINMVLQHHGQYSSTNGSNVNPNWEQNPYNAALGGFLNHAYEFFTNTTAVALTKKKYRYIIARWGYSPAVMGWELCNEIENTDAAYLNEWTNIQSWADQMSDFIHAQDPYHHLVTISSDLTEPIWDKTDYYQHHDYPSDLINGIQGAADIASNQTVAPDFGGECGIDFTPHVGVSPPIWASLMNGQSAADMPWYWDTIDPNNDYFLIQAAADFVNLSGIADENALIPSTPEVTGGIPGPLIFAPGGGFRTATQSNFVVGETAPVGIGSAPAYLQGDYHRSMTPNGYTFEVDYSSHGTFSVQVIQIASSGAGLNIYLDNDLATNISFPSDSAGDTSTNFTVTINLAAGPHSINIMDPGLDWVLLGNITLSPYVPTLAAYAVGTNNWQAVWIWNQTNIFSASPGPSIAGTVAIGPLSPGIYSGTWWDTFGAGAVSNFTVTVTNSNPVTIDTPLVTRSMALYVGQPAKGGVTLPNLSQVAQPNSPVISLPVILTNSGGLPLTYSITANGPLPSWLTVSSTNGTVPKSNATEISLALSPAGLDFGAYNFTLQLTTGDASFPATNLPISLIIPAPPPQLEAMSAANGQLLVQLEGIPGLSYILETSTDLATWTPVSTNGLNNATLLLTNAIPSNAPQQFWRAVWQP
jgi:hypothetical protein